MSEQQQQEFKVGIGDVPITLGGQEYVLRPSLNACLVISRGSGGIRGAIQKVMDLDIDTIVRIIQVGLGPNTARKLKNLDEMVYQAGLVDTSGQLTTKCIEFLSNISNGGRPLDDSSKEAGEDENPR